MERVNVLDIQFQDDYSYTQQGIPFTGVAFELAPTGELISEMTFVGGVQEGPVREWYSSGAKRAEKNLHHGSLHGIASEWYESGKPKLVKRCELGICIESDEWDESGNLVRQYRLSENDPNYKTLKLLRQKQWKS